MEGYESIFITDPDLSEEVREKVLEKVRNTVSHQGGTVEQYHAWGRRRLAHLINKKTHGDYHLMYLTGGEAMLKELAQQYRFTEEIMRFQTIKVSDIEKESEFFLKINKKETPTFATATESQTEGGTEPTSENTTVASEPPELTPTEEFTSNEGKEESVV